MTNHDHPSRWTMTEQEEKFWMIDMKASAREALLRGWGRDKAITVIVEEFGAELAEAAAVVERAIEEQRRVIERCRVIARAKRLAEEARVQRIADRQGVVS